MKKGILISSLLLLLMVSVFIGCSDDDEKTITAAAAAQGYLIGYVNYYNPGYEFYTDVMPMTNNGFMIDSIVSVDSIAEYRTDSYWNVYGDDNYHWAEIDQNPASTYSPGDTAEVFFYRNGSMATLRLELLDYDIYPNVILPVDDDSISLGESLNILWNTNQDAEWYGMYIRYYQDSAGTYVSKRYYITTTDTTFTIPASTNIYDGYYNIYIVAVNGPTTGDPVNLNGAGLLGEFHSYTGSEYRRVYVGTGDPFPVGGGSDEEIMTPEEASRDIMDHITGHELHKDNH